MVGIKLHQTYCIVSTAMSLKQFHFLPCCCCYYFALHLNSFELVPLQVGQYIYILCHLYNTLANLPKKTLTACTSIKINNVFTLKSQQ